MNFVSKSHQNEELCSIKNEEFCIKIMNIKIMNFAGCGDVTMAVSQVQRAQRGGRFGDAEVVGHTQVWAHT